ncbi:myosin-14 [Solanum pennellii]|uniref:Myosin-14 n=1 Tax=Solanum pennellii TaxID=28526 RepID=A0ABM1GG78_SOLPN|nr:myosin-14 [Solanum pennellii]
MDEKGVLSSCLITSEGRRESLCPIFFGVSCAFVALGLLPEPEKCDATLLEVRNRMLQGSAHLLGLLVWRVQRYEARNEKSELLLKLANAEKKIEELKGLRREDAKANEKVVCIYAAQEQCWFNERKKLRQQIGAFMNELRVVEKHKDTLVAELDCKLEESKVVVQSKDKIIEDEGKARHDLEEKLKKAEAVAEELRNTAKFDAQRHSNEISKHKTAFIELVSNQRQLEAEMGRALRQAEAAKQEVSAVLEQKEQAILMTQKLSMELVKMRKDLEQKEQILSAMLRKSKLDTTEKQMLLKEIKLSKAKRQQAELETERWKTASESWYERHSLRNMLYKRMSPKLEVVPSGKGMLSSATMLPTGKSRSHKADYLLDEQPEGTKEPELFPHVPDKFLTEDAEEEIITDDVEHLENWVRSEAEKYSVAVEHRHHRELDAFAEQLRLKDERLEAFRWRLLSMELESKRLQSHIEVLDHDLAQLRQDNMKLDALLLNREVEVQSLKQQLTEYFHLPDSQKSNANACPKEQDKANHTVWSNVTLIKTKLGEKEQETKNHPEETSQKVKNGRKVETRTNNPQKDIILTLQYPTKEIGEAKDGVSHMNASKTEHFSTEDARNAGTSTSECDSEIKKNKSLWKMDLHALGVSYKIKRLTQQFVMLERLTSKQEPAGNSENNDNGRSGTRGFRALMSLLNKQVARYESLQGKIDDLCKRMHENGLNVNCEGSVIRKTKEETKLLEHFLEETFQLQRYIVATGQKLMEVQTKIASGFVVAAEELDTPASFDVKRFADGIRTLFREVQRGLEVRVSRIIGDLEGTLACDGITYFKR